MKITALTENTSKNPLIKCEHGLSLYIEACAHRILFDSGQSGLFAENAEKLSIDLSTVDTAVLSHGHYDHGGGLGHFLRINSTAPVYLSRRAFGKYYNGTEKYIGLDETLKSSDRLVFTDDEYRIAEGLTLYSCNKMRRPHEFRTPDLLTLNNGVFASDEFLHEQYLLIEENGMRMLISACSHKGILNIAEWFKPDVFTGGFHMMKISDRQAITDYAERLSSMPTEFYTCHCTGTEQFSIMKPLMKNLHYLSAGETIII